VLVYARELDVGLAGGSDDEAVDDALGDRFRHAVPEEVLHDHGRGVGLNLIGAEDVGHGGAVDLVEGYGRRANDVACPAVDELFKLGGGVLGEFTGDTVH
jgi:hypothetical protein